MILTQKKYKFIFTLKKLKLSCNTTSRQHKLKKKKPSFIMYQNPGVPGFAKPSSRVLNPGVWIRAKP
jgi:hypothetical protein